MTRLARLSGGHEIADWIAKRQQAWALYLSTHDVLSPMAKESPVPFLSAEDRVVLSTQGWILLLFDDMREAHDAFVQVVGDERPIAGNPYTGKHRVYAYFAGPLGGISENT